MKRMHVLVGNYGSGKTEIAINLAVEGAGAGLRTLVIDLDKVNDYFRMSDKVSLLAQKQINLVSPTFAGRGVTPSSMSAAVASAFTDSWDLVIFDVGGDAAGALSQGRYHQDFAAWEGELQVYDIVNVFRPMSETAEKILKLREELEGFARLPVTALVQSSELRKRRGSAPGLRGHPGGLPPLRPASGPHHRPAGVFGGISGRRAGPSLHRPAPGPGDLHAPQLGILYPGGYLGRVSPPSAPAAGKEPKEQKQPRESLCSRAAAFVFGSPFAAGIAPTCVGLLDRMCPFCSAVPALSGSILPRRSLSVFHRISVLALGFFFSNWPFPCLSGGAVLYSLRKQIGPGCTRARPTCSTGESG